MDTDRPQGDPVDLSTDCIFPPHEKIAGSLVELLPLKQEHADGLFPTIGGEEHPSLYDYMGYGPFNDLDAFRSHITHLSNGKDPQFHAIVDKETSKLVGQLSYLRIDPKNRVIEIGHIMYSPSLQKTPQATEVFYLLANKAFENGYRRLEWKCDANNAASRGAAGRLGFTFEGVFRQHMIVKGRNRDTAWFSILDKEWPARKRAFEAWLDPSNFDQERKQVKALKQFQDAYS
ncbi:uncharacterized protein LTR77_007015 [Saxophila tyrrhenica]|uniref:N-acetyltransferase domain-containing protein n=1 Tax=Saxophila tyrrhenica TaxID=1690608 RepID=A0AAV9P9F9_9PEZI|nr:hypothetical protein LTR77_007015 [Saxophila tyrrhenica]